MSNTIRGEKCVKSMMWPSHSNRWKNMMKCGIKAFGRSNKAMVVTIGPLEVYFSYSTPIAFRDAGGNLVARVNEWGPSTGMHMNDLGVDRKDRIPGEEFERRLTEHLRALFRDGVDE